MSTPPPPRSSLRERAHDLLTRELAFWREDRPFALVFWLLALLFAAPALAAYLPLQDFYYHVEMAHLWSAVSAGASPFQSELIARGGATPYLSYYVYLRAVGALIGVEAAARLALLGYTLATPLATLALARVSGRSRWLALWGFLWIWSTSLAYGFVPNALSLPLCFASLAMLKRQLDAPAWWRDVVGALLLIALYFTHVAGTFAFAIAGPVLFFAQVRRPRAILRHSLFTYPALAIALWWSSRTVSSKGWAVKRTGFMDHVGMIKGWVNNMLTGHSDEAALITGAVIWLALLCLSLARHLRARAVADDTAAVDTPEDAPTQDAIRAPWSIGVAGVALLVVFFLLPRHVQRPMYQWMTAARMLVFAFGLLVFLVNAQITGRWRLMAAPLVVALALYGAQLNLAFTRYAAEVAPIGRALEKAAPKTRLLPLFDHPRAPGFHANAWLSVPNLHTVRRDGYVPLSFASHGVMPVQFRRKHTPAPHWKRSPTYRYSRHGRHYTYLLHIAAPEHRRRAARLKASLRKRTEVVHQEGRITLYRVRPPNPTTSKRTTRAPGSKKRP